MAGRPSHRVRSKEKVQELNVLPVMNVFMILVPFLLLSAAFVQLTIVDTSLPARGTGEPSKSPDDNTPKLNLTVFIRDDGFMLAGYGGVLLVDEQNGGETSPEGVEAPASTRFTIEKKEIEGKLDFDWDRLRETLVKVKEAYPKHFSIILLPDNGIDYATIVRMMDVSREYEIKAPDGTKKTEWLFPSPVLAWAVK